jgi:hypothetical protein
MRLCLVSSNHNRIVALWVGETTLTSTHSLAKQDAYGNSQLGRMKCSIRIPTEGIPDAFQQGYNDYFWIGEDF